MGHIGVGRCPSEKGMDGRKLRGSGFGAIFGISTQVLVTLSGFQPRTTPETQDPGQTKAGNGFGILEVDITLNSSCIAALAKVRTMS